MLLNVLEFYEKTSDLRDVQDRFIKFEKAFGWVSSSVPIGSLCKCNNFFTFYMLLRIINSVACHDLAARN